MLVALRVFDFAFGSSLATYHSSLPLKRRSRFARHSSPVTRHCFFVSWGDRKPGGWPSADGQSRSPPCRQRAGAFPISPCPREGGAVKRGDHKGNVPTTEARIRGATLRPGELVYNGGMKPEDKLIRAKGVFFSHTKEDRGLPDDLSVPEFRHWTGLEPVPCDDYHVDYDDGIREKAGRLRVKDPRLEALRRLLDSWILPLTKNQKCCESSGRSKRRSEAVPGCSTPFVYISHHRRWHLAGLACTGNSRL
jgi:hypothetical protein